MNFMDKVAVIILLLMTLSFATLTFNITTGVTPSSSTPDTLRTGFEFSVNDTYNLTGAWSYLQNNPALIITNTSGNNLTPPSTVLASTFAPFNYTLLPNINYTIIGFGAPNGNRDFGGCTLPIDNGTVKWWARVLRAGDSGALSGFDSTECGAPWALNLSQATPDALLTPAPAYYTTTVQGSINDSSNLLNATAINWTLYVNGSNFTSGGITNGTTGFVPSLISLFNLSSFTFKSNLTLSVWENYTDGSSKTRNSSNLTISKSPILINSVNLTPTTGYASATLSCAIRLTDNDTYAPYQPVNVSISWFKNGANQTGLFTTLNVTNNTVNSTNLSIGFTVGDQWLCSAYANDTNTTAGPVNSSAVVIGGMVSPPTGLPSIIYNFKDATTGASVNASFSILYNETFPDGTMVSVSFSGTNNSTTINILPNTTINLTAIETAASSGYYSNTVYHNYSATNVSQTVIVYMYPINASYATTITLFQNPNIPITGVQINIYNYSAPSTYTLVQSCTTNPSGNCLVYLVPNTQYYLFNFTALGSAQTQGPQVVTCSVPASGCFQTFILNQPEFPYATAGTYGGNCTFNNISNVLTCTSSATGSTIKNVNLTTVNFGTSNIVCTNQSATINNTLTCQLPSVNGSYAYGLFGIDNVNNTYLMTNGYLNIGIAPVNYGPDGWLAMFMLFAIIAMAGAVSLTLSIALGVLALILGVMFGFAPLASIQSVIIVCATIGGVIIWRLKL